MNPEITIIAEVEAVHFDNHKDTVEILLNNGADVDLQDNRGNTALMLATMHNHKDIVDILKTEK